MKLIPVLKSLLSKRSKVKEDASIAAILGNAILMQAEKTGNKIKIFEPIKFINLTNLT